MTDGSFRPSVLFLGLTYAGHETRFLNLQAHTTRDPRIRPSYHRVSGWRDGGWIERVPLLPPAVKGRVRATLTSAAIARLPRPDVIWTSVGESTTPYLWSQIGPIRRPIVRDLDCTLAQQEAHAPIYFRRPAKRGPRMALARLQERLLWRYVTLFLPWSQWAADSLREQGVEDRRIHVLPPGVDLDAWRPRPELRGQCDGPLRLLFVGGDFERKGGPLLLEVMRTGLADRCVVDIVTRDPVAETPGVRVHRAQPNSPLLRELYARADVFVLPTRAECFGIATVEALASGIPAVVSNVGGARDIVEHERTGWLIEPTVTDLRQTLEQVLLHRDRLAGMGQEARAAAERRFNGEHNDAHLVGLLVEQAERHRRRRAAAS